MEIIPIDKPGDHRTGTLVGLTPADINERLGFAPNISDDWEKVSFSWGFTVDGIRCGIWDYMGSWKHNSFSTFGPHEVFQELFGDNYKG